MDGIAGGCTENENSASNSTGRSGAGGQTANRWQHNDNCSARELALIRRCKVCIQKLVRLQAFRRECSGERMRNRRGATKMTGLPST
jgi:hypothetical protein